MTGLIVLTNGFEDVEAIATIDVLRRSGIRIDTTSLDNKEIITQSNNTITVDYLLHELNLEDYTFLILPGGKAVFNILDKDKRIDNLIDNFYNNNKLICAICAAPRLIAKRGYFKNLNFTIFPGCLDGEVLGNILNNGVVVEEKFITAKSMYYSIEFALEIINKLQGNEQRKIIEDQIKGIK